MYKRYMFYKRSQKHGESFNVFLMDSRKFTWTCEFKEQLDEALRDGIVMGIADAAVQEKLPITLSGKSVFTVLDMKDGFLQISSDKESTDLCTFIISFRKYKFNKLPFGLSVSPETFQRVTTKFFGEIDNVSIYFGDTIISGKDTSEHDVTVNKVMERALQYNIKCNPNKVQFRFLKLNSSD